ncbi:MAG: hypothetical protein ACJ8AH_24690 [Stellaceae bacterium]
MFAASVIAFEFLVEDRRVFLVLPIAAASQVVERSTGGALHCLGTGLHFPRIGFEAVGV